MFDKESELLEVPPSKVEDNQQPIKDNLSREIWLPEKVQRLFRKEVGTKQYRSALQVERRGMI